MNKFLKISVIMLFVIALLITGGILMSKDKKPLHEQIAEYMFNSRALPKLEYCVEKYGEEFVLTDTGDVISTRLPMTFVVNVSSLLMVILFALQILGKKQQLLNY